MYLMQTSQGISREDAIADTIAIWREMAITGSLTKSVVIRRLYDKGIITKKHYSINCPLCEYTN